jgi:DNA-binding FadR family transcriptional regulator
MAPLPSLFGPIKDKSLYQQVVDRIRIAIFRGDLKPGDKLPPEPELARQFGVGRSAVREGIRMLETIGLLTVRRGHSGGTFVRERDIASRIPLFADLLRLSLVEVTELTHTRILLESLVIKEAASRIDASGLAALHMNVDQAEEFFRQGDVTRRVAANLDFHVALARVAGNSVLELNIGAVLELLSYYLATITPSREMIQHTLASHRRLLELLEKGRTEEAIKLNQEHIEAISQKLVARAKEDAHQGRMARHLVIENEKE